MSAFSHANEMAATVHAERARWSRPTQTCRLLEKLRECRTQGIALSLPEIQRLGIAQHGARLNELRRRGHVIKNHMTRAADGTIRSSYTLDFDAEAGR
jgi:hypothetical protein